MNDIEALKIALTTHGAPSVNVERFRRRAAEAGWFDWTSDRLNAAFQQLESLGAVSHGKEGRYRINFDVLYALETSSAEVSADAQAEEAAPSVETPPAVKLVNKLPPKKLSRLDALLGSIESIEAPKVYEGDEREAKLAEAFDTMIETITSVNSAIVELSKRTDLVDADTDQISLVRVQPSGTGVGGVEATYKADGRHSKVLFRTPWADKLTDRWIRDTNKRLEDAAIDMLGRMVKYVKKHSR